VDEDGRVGAVEVSEAAGVVGIEVRLDHVLDVVDPVADLPEGGPEIPLGGVVVSELGVQCRRPVLVPGVGGRIPDRRRGVSLDGEVRVGPDRATTDDVYRCVHHATGEHASGPYHRCPSAGIYYRFYRTIPDRLMYGTDHTRSVFEGASGRERNSGRETGAAASPTERGSTGDETR
jgi:hypothetical protein